MHRLWKSKDRADAPPEALPRASAREWRVIGSSVRGAAHIRTGVDNQDAIAWLPQTGIGARVIVSVADGHGSAKSFRSATGARLAIEVSNGLAAELLDAPGDRAGLSWVKDRLELDAPQRIVREWRLRVAAELARSPLTEVELARVSASDGEDARALVEGDPHLAYGSTLVTAVAAESFMAFWQIGDGDVLVVTDGDGASRPLPRDDRLIANETTSLCSTDAWRLFRVAVFGTPAPVVMVSTDGLSNSFRDNDGFLRFGADVMRMLNDEGVESVGRKLHDWLSEMTHDGSGDDISVGIACRRTGRPSRLPDQSETSVDSVIDDGAGIAPGADCSGGRVRREPRPRRHMMRRSRPAGAAQRQDGQETDR